MDVRVYMSRDRFDRWQGQASLNPSAGDPPHLTAYHTGRSLALLSAVEILSVQKRRNLVIGSIEIHNSHGPQVVAEFSCEATESENSILQLFADCTEPVGGNVRAA